MRWLAVRLDLISIALITTTGLMIVLMHGQIPPAYSGLAISYAVQVSLGMELMLTGVLCWPRRGMVGGSALAFETPRASAHLPS